MPGALSWRPVGAGINDRPSASKKSTTTFDWLDLCIVIWVTSISEKFADPQESISLLRQDRPSTSLEGENDDGSDMECGLSLVAKALTHRFGARGEREPATDLGADAAGAPAGCDGGPRDPPCDTAVERHCPTN